MSSITVSYTPVAGSPTYAAEFSEFAASALPRSYSEVGTFTVSAPGATVLSGPPIRRRYQWTVSAPLTYAGAASVDAMFRAWEEDRANGALVALGIVDTTFGGTVTSSAVFTSPPIFDQYGPANMLVSFSLTEV